LLLVVAAVSGALLLAASPAGAAPGPRVAATALGWQSLTNPPPFNPGVMLLLTDGRVLVQDTGSLASGTPDWWLLTPDSQGNYADGTWTQAASMPSDYAPLYAASAVLPDGRVIVEGGEYNLGQFVETNKGAVYDPVANTWTAVAPPDGGTGGWAGIGDGPSVVLANGSFLLGASALLGNTAEAILNASNLTWTPTGDGKYDGNGEEGFTLLPSGKVLTVDAQAGCTTSHTEIYDPASGTWTSAGATPKPLVNCDDGEIGPQMLMHDGRVFVPGATSASALYDTTSGTWSAGPDLPVIGGKQFIAEDASSALLPDGKVLVELSPGVGITPTHFYLFDGTNLAQTVDAGDAANVASNYVYMLMLPTGQALVGPGLQLYSDGGAPDAASAPQITSVPNNLTAGDTYTVSGTQLNGLSDGAAFGDDWQMSTDYPLVQITHDATSTVTYARTFGMTNRSIAHGAASTSDFALPTCIPQGPSHLRVVADGIASAAVAVTVGELGCAKALTVTSSGSGDGTVTSSPQGIDCGSVCSHPFADGTEVTLTASPATGSTFTGWAGACSGAASCTLDLTADSSAAATFTLKPVCVVPKVTGKRLAAARSAITHARCKVGKIGKAFSARVKAGRVISQKPRPKTTLKAGSAVKLTVSKGKHRTP
jgi:hypothetical protein